jgi:hypothetical protein
MFAIIALVGGQFLLVMSMALFIFPIVLALFVFWIWMLVEAIQNKGLSEGEKIAWVLVIVFTHWLGALLYFLIGHPKRKTPLTA